MANLFPIVQHTPYRVRFTRRPSTCWIIEMEVVAVSEAHARAMACALFGGRPYFDVTVTPIERAGADF